MKKIFVLLALLGICNGCTSIRVDKELHQQTSENELVEKVSFGNNEALQRAVKKIKVTLSNHNAKPNRLKP